MHWFRLYNHMVDDEKLRLLAFEDRWHFVALCCLCSDGLLSEPDCELRTRKIAVKLGVQVRELDEITRRLREVGLIDESMAPCAWDELQYRSDISTNRVKKYREKQRRNGVKRCETVSVTAQEIELESEESPSGDRPSGDGLTSDHVFEGYQKLAAELGLTVPRDFTPERRQLVRGRVAQYSLEDFQTVFAKCRDSPFLRGDKGRTPLAFDWVMKKCNFQKVLEGNYDR